MLYRNSDTTVHFCKMTSNLQNLTCSVTEFCSKNAVGLFVMKCENNAIRGKFTTTNKRASAVTMSSTTYLLECAVPSLVEAPGWLQLLMLISVSSLSSRTSRTSGGCWADWKCDSAKTSSFSRQSQRSARDSPRNRTVKQWNSLAIVRLTRAVKL